MRLSWGCDNFKAKNIFRQNLGKSLCAWLYPRAQHIDFGLYFCARGYSHAHVRVAKSRARILYTNTQSGKSDLGGGNDFLKLDKMMERED